MATPDSVPALHLWILRHAKAVASAPPGGADFDRPLTARGRRDATALGSALDARMPGLDGVPLPEVALCSAAARTEQTARLVATASGAATSLVSYRSLYDADTDLVLRYVREIDGDVRGALLVGHNPTMYRLAWSLLAEPDGDRDSLRAHGFPTCSLAVMVLDVGAWEDVTEGCARLVGLFAPPY